MERLTVWLILTGKKQRKKQQASLGGCFSDRTDPWTGSFFAAVCRLGMALLFGYELLHIIKMDLYSQKMGDLGRRYFILVSCGYTGIYSLIYLQ